MRRFFLAWGVLTLWVVTACYNPATTTIDANTSCAAGLWNHDGNAATPCIEWSRCRPGQFVESPGTAVADQRCASCADATFSTATNTTTCALWTECIKDEKVATAGSAIGDRVCEACPTDEVSVPPNATACRPVDLYVASYNTGAVQKFAVGANGNAAPINNLQGAATGFSSPSGVTVFNDELFVSDQGNGSVRVFANASTATGNVAPIRVLEGITTELSIPRGLMVYNNELYVLIAGGIAVFPIDATGNVAPTRLMKSSTLSVGGIDMKIVNDEIFVGNDRASCLVFAANGNGEVTPLRQFTVSVANGIAVRGAELFVTTGNNNSVQVFPTNANGVATPLRTIAGATTMLSYANRAFIFGTQLYVANFSASSITIFDINDSGDVAPTRTISGDNTLINGAWGIWIE